MEGEGGPFLVHYDLFFLLDSQVVCIFCPKKCLTTLRVVMCVTYTRSSSERLSGCLFKDDKRPGETISRRYMPYPIGMYVWTLLVNENDWAFRLGHHPVVFSQPGSVGRSSWAQAHGTHNAPFFLLGRTVVPG